MNAHNEEVTSGQIHEEHPSSKGSSKNALELKNVTVQYRAYRERPGTFKEHVIRCVKSGRWPKSYTTFKALNNLSFSIPAGSSVGIIGSNGAGKSTLLKTLSGVLKPSRGQVLRRGRVDSLISLGAGFDRELNAIENIFLYGSLHQFTRARIAERVPKILEFAELTEFAQTPVKYYSSGMFARLGFSCALDMDPDILLVDEVLSVGDSRFRKKSNEAMKKHLTSGKTIVIVSHALNSLKDITDRIIVLSKGEVVFDGDPSEAIRMYLGDDYKTALDGKRLG
ncbi:MAG: ABC transporter ATP-binding protein [Bdellovibrionales bacterium]|nr:ABC transporter ATP-binding protein [Bdellovibrionales bacterium]